MSTIKSGNSVENARRYKHNPDKCEACTVGGDKPGPRAEAAPSRAAQPAAKAAAAAAAAAAKGARGESAAAGERGDRAHLSSEAREPEHADRSGAIAEGMKAW